MRTWTTIVICLGLLTQVSPSLYQNALSADSVTNTCASDWVRFGPDEVRLQGRLKMENVFGPPNFGENPESDRVVSIYVLELDEAINVQGNINDELNTNDFRCQNRIQVVPDNESLLNMLVGRDVRVVGKLFQAHTGHHYTNVLISLSLIEAEKKI